eukprot:1158805-Pelagomonas_calceolata.AAC.3
MASLVHTAFCTVGNSAPGHSLPPGCKCFFKGRQDAVTAEVLPRRQKLLVGGMFVLHGTAPVAAYTVHISLSPVYIKGMAFASYLLSLIFQSGHCSFLPSQP